MYITWSFNLSQLTSYSARLCVICVYSKCNTFPSAQCPVLTHPWLTHINHVLHFTVSSIVAVSPHLGQPVWSPMTAQNGQTTSTYLFMTERNRKKKAKTETKLKPKGKVDFGASVNDLIVIPSCWLIVLVARCWPFDNNWVTITLRDPTAFFM